MFDLTDLTNVVKKTTKKATDLTMKPVQFVAAPLVDMHNKLRKSVFWPDLVFLTEVQQKEQYAILMEAYEYHCDTIKQQLHKTKLVTKKIDTYVHAIKLIWAAHELIKDPQAKIEAMQNLFDELRSVCKEYIPTVLKEETFSSPKKIITTEDEFKIIAKAISSSKVFLQHCASEIEDNSSQIACHGLPWNESVQEAIISTQKVLPETQQSYQDNLFATQKVIHDWYSIIHSIQESAAHLRVYTNNEKSLFGPEKTKAKKSYENELGNIKKVISHDFTNWKKNIETTVKKTQKQQHDLFAIIPALESINNKWVELYTNQVKEYEKQWLTAKKQFASYALSLTKTLQEEQNKLKSSYSFMEKRLVVPYDQEELIAECADEIVNQHNIVHVQYHLSAHHIRQSALISEMPVVFSWLALTQQKTYLMEKLSLHRQQLFHAKLMKRLRKGIISEVQSYENIIDDHKIYAKETITPVLTYLRDLTNKLQNELKWVELQISHDNITIETIKTQVWDSITVDRLIGLKRSWQNDLLWSAIGLTHKKQLDDELKIHQKEIKTLQTISKEIEKRNRIDVTAFHEHKKTVQIIKTKDQKEKLEILKTQINNQEKTIQHLNELILLINTHIKELDSLVKKYWIFAKNHEVHAQSTKKRINDLAKKLIKSPLQNDFDCSDSCNSALWA
jgi:hypothetical protein